MKNYKVLFVGVLISSLSIGMNQTVSAQVPQQDSLALVALFDSTDGANWDHKLNLTKLSWLKRKNHHHKLNLIFLQI